MGRCAEVDRQTDRQTDRKTDGWKGEEVEMKWKRRKCRKELETCGGMVLWRGERERERERERDMVKVSKKKT